MTSFRHILTRMDKVENLLLPQKQTIVVVQDKIKGIIHYNGKTYADEKKFLKALGDKKPTHILTICTHPSLIGDTEETA